MNIQYIKELIKTHGESAVNNFYQEIINDLLKVEQYEQAAEYLEGLREAIKLTKQAAVEDPLL